jgi:hypothetical protein
MSLAENQKEPEGPFYTCDHPRGTGGEITGALVNGSGLTWFQS